MKTLLVALLLAAAPGAAQERIAIIGGRVVTNMGAPLEGGTVLLSDGVVTAVNPPGAPVPADSGWWMPPASG